jgi:hypothetical protein
LDELNFSYLYFFGLANKNYAKNTNIVQISE